MRGSATRIEIGDHGVTLVQRGPEDALPVVFIHGFPFSHRMWKPQLEALSDEFRCIAYDLRGLGTSQVGDGQYTIEFYVDDLVGLLGALGIERAVLCGLSMGGYVALRAIEREPGSALGLVLADTRSAQDSDEGRLKRAEAIRTIKTRGMHAYAEGILGQLLAEETFERRPAEVERLRRIIESSEPGGVCGAQLAMAARTDTTGVLAHIAVPVLLLAGERDTLTPPEVAEAMRERIPDAELHIVPGAGHLSNVENPDDFNAALRPFLRRIEWPR